MQICSKRRAVEPRLNDRNLSSIISFFKVSIVRGSSSSTGTRRYTALFDRPLLEPAVNISNNDSLTCGSRGHPSSSLRTCGTLTARVSDPGRRAHRSPPQGGEICGGPYCYTGCF